MCKLNRNAAAILVICLTAWASPAAACPFCNAVKPTLAQQREAATVVVLAEATDSASTGDKQSFAVHKILKGKDRVAGETLSIVADPAVKSGSLALLLANPAAPKASSAGIGALKDPTPRAVDASVLAWTAIPLDEVAYAYVAGEPDLRQPSSKRLAFFARFLESSNSLLADDAIAEFAQASFDQTAEVADRLPMENIRHWIVDPHVPQDRKGFYGLTLGLAKSDQERSKNRELLRQLVLEKADDFRAGFDGVLAAYLLLTGRDGLKLIDERYFSNPKAADGDVRHALKAARFYDQYGHDMKTAELAAAVEHLLARPEFAAEVTTDLARWQDWTATKRIAGLYQEPAYSDADTRRAIVGFLKVCPTADAAEALNALRRADPKGVAAAEEYFSAISGGR